MVQAPVSADGFEWPTLQAFSALEPAAEDLGTLERSLSALHNRQAQDALLQSQISQLNDLPTLAQEAPVAAAEAPVVAAPSETQRETQLESQLLELNESLTLLKTQNVSATQQLAELQESLSSARDTTQLMRAERDSAKHDLAQAEEIAQAAQDQLLRGQEEARSIQKKDKEVIEQLSKQLMEQAQLAQADKAAAEQEKAAVRQDAERRVSLAHVEMAAEVQAARDSVSRVERMMSTWANPTLQAGFSAPVPLMSLLAEPSGSSVVARSMPGLDHLDAQR